MKKIIIPTIFLCVLFLPRAVYTEESAELSEADIFGSGPADDMSWSEDDIFGGDTFVPEQVEAQKKWLDFVYRCELKEELRATEANSDTPLNPHEIMITKPPFLTRSVADVELKFFLWDKFDIVFGDSVLYTYGRGNSLKDATTRNSLKNLYVTYHLTEGNLITVGRENYPIGVSYAWNPTDFLSTVDETISPNERDNRTIREQRQGVFFVKSENFFDFGVLTALYAPRLHITNVKTNTHDQTVLKFKPNLHPTFKPEFVYSNAERDAFGGSVTYGVNNQLLLQYEIAFTKGTSRGKIESIESFGFTEYMTDLRDQDHLYARMVGGINYTFKDLTNVIIELYYNEEGFTRDESKTMFDAAEDLATRIRPGSSDPYDFIEGMLADVSEQYDPLNFNKFYGFFRITKPDFPINNFTPYFFVMMNLQDGSAFVNTKFEYKFKEHFVTAIGANVYLGNDNTEFGEYFNTYDTFWSVSIFF